MAAKTLDILFHETLKDIYYAERKILRALPKMARAAQDPKLKEAFTHHKEETEGQIERLQKVFELIGKPPDLPRVFHPAATRARLVFTPIGAG